MKIIFDYNRTLFNPDTDALYGGVAELLSGLADGNTLFLVSRNEPGRRDRLARLGIEQYFQRIVFSDAKSSELFEDLVQNGKGVVVGDRVKDEICIGNSLGFVTIWVRQGKFANEVPTKAGERPTFTVENIVEVKLIISRL